MSHMPSKAFWLQSNPKTIASEYPVLVSRNSDIENLLAYDSNGNNLGRPKVETFYAKIEEYGLGKLVTIVNGGYIASSDSREPHEYDVYSCAPDQFQNQPKSKDLKLVAV